MACEYLGITLSELEKTGVKKVSDIWKKAFEREGLYIWKESSRKEKIRHSEGSPQEGMTQGTTNMLGAFTHDSARRNVE